MSNEAIITTIETVEKKLKKYIALKEQEKVKEYLRKLSKISLTPTIIQETKIDRLIRHIASNKTVYYHSLAKHLLKKWYHKKLISKSTKVKPTINTTSTIIVENKTNDEERNSDEISESQSSNDNKKRKVLSLAQYLENKKHVLSPSSTVNSIQNKLTDTQIRIINAQFKATTEKLAASAPDLTKTIDKSLTEADKSNNRMDLIIKRPVIQQSKTKLQDLWTEEDDDDDDFCMQSPNNQSNK